MNKPNQGFATAIPSVLALLALAGCANEFSIHHKFKPDDGTSISIDAKQRAIYTIEKDFSSDDKKWRAICAEPSPDALTALSVGTGIDAATLSKSLGVAFSGQEGAASIGLRTQSITILRDVMYRLCEGYASGALDDIGFARLHRRYQSIVIGLLAVEQVTGAVVAQQAAIGGASSARLGQSLAQVSVMVQEARGRAVAAKAAAVAAKTKADAAGDEAKKAEDAYAKAVKDAGGSDSGQAAKDAKAAFDAKAKAAADLKAEAEKAAQKDAVESSEVASLEALRKELDRATTFASASAAFSPPRAASASADAASAVLQIVKTVVERDYTAETCLDAALSRSLRSLASRKGETAALEIALNYCAYAVGVRAIAERPGTDPTRDRLISEAREQFQRGLSEAIKRVQPAAAAAPSAAPAGSAPTK